MTEWREDLKPEIPEALLKRLATVKERRIPGDNKRTVAELQKFGLDPALTLDEYENVSWKELFPYVAYPDMEEISFKSFVDACKAAVVYEEGKRLERKANEGAERILAMTQEEWDEYRHGIRWSQKPHADDIRQRGLNDARYLLGTVASSSDLFFLKKNQRGPALSKVFLPLKTTQLLKENSEIVVPRFDPFGPRQYATINSLLHSRRQEK